MSNERLYCELEEICNYDYDEMQRTLDSLQNMLTQSREFEDKESDVLGFDKERELIRLHEN